MEENDFFTSLESHFDQVLPWVAYRKPHETVVKAFLQEDDTVYTTQDFTDSGFVFAPFNSDQEQTVLIPSSASQTISLNQEVTSKEEGASGRILKNVGIDYELGTKDTHIDLVKKGIQKIQSGVLKKVVLSRKQTATYTDDTPFDIFKRLLDQYSTAFVYCWYHPKIGLWLGATPETLVTIKNRQLKTMSLAGTQKGVDIEGIVWGQKEREEQQLVTDSIVNSLNSLVNHIEVSGAQTHKAGSLLHLKTDVSAQIDSSKASLATILKALHPTPAVCGLPKTKAKEFILSKEGYDRMYYTGFLGELNLSTDKMRSRSRRNVENLAYRSVSKNTALFVNLRCMEIDVKGAQLYVGGGITDGSNPESEWEETVHKLQTMGRVL